MILHEHFAAAAAAERERERECVHVRMCELHTTNFCTHW